MLAKSEILRSEYVWSMPPHFEISFRKFRIKPPNSLLRVRRLMDRKLTTKNCQWTLITKLERFILKIILLVFDKSM